MKPRAQVADVVDEFMDWRDEENYDPDYNQIRPRGDGLDRMDEEEIELLHVEEV